MKKNNLLLVIFVLLISALFVSTVAYAKDINIVQSVDNVTSVDVYTVPSGKKFSLKDVVIGNYNSSSCCCARIFKNSADILYVAVPADGHFAHQFTNVTFRAGDVLTIRNGDNAGIIMFNITGKEAAAP